MNDHDRKAAPLFSSGHPLKVRRVMGKYSVGLRELAKAARISSTAMQSVIAHDTWPRRASATFIKDQVIDCLRKAGASKTELADLFTRYAPCVGGNSKQRQANEEESMLMQKQTLSEQARKAFTLFVNPFDGVVTSAKEMFQTGETRYVREAIWQTAINARFVAVIGESGAGKTTVLGDLKERIIDDRKAVVVIEPSVLGMEDTDTKGKTLKSADVLSSIILQLDPLATIPNTSVAREHRVRQALEQSTQAGHSHVLVIEEAHSLPIPLLRHLKRLAERMHYGRRPMLGILLLGHPELEQKLRRHDVREVAQRCEIVTLRPLDGSVGAYLAHRAKAIAERDLGAFITPDGVEALRTRLTVSQPGRNATPISLQYPLAVNNLMTAALNMAAELGAPLVTRDVIQAL